MMRDEELGTPDAYFRAFEKIQREGIPENHIAMLTAHSNAPNHTATWAQIAEAVGYANGNAVNLQYGKLAGRIAPHLGIVNRPHGFWLHVLADWAKEVDPRSGHTAFVLRPVVIKALTRLGVLSEAGTQESSGMPRSGHLRSIDDFPVQQVADALRRFKWTSKAKTLVYALATASNRSMSRLELARTIGSESVESCNRALGTFGRNLALELDPSLAAEWKPASGPPSDWVMFMNWAPRRWTAPGRGEQDTWVFLMRETLANALDEIGFASLQELDDEARNKTYGLKAFESDEGVRNPFSDIKAAAGELENLSVTERESVVKARVGQGIFRDRLLEAWEGRCAVTGSGFAPALVASHIKPWIMSTNDERLDAANGLLLVGTLDRLFDRGFITFEIDGLIRISPRIPEDEYASLQLSPSMRLRQVPPQCLPFLDQHRRESFVGEMPRSGQSG